MSKIAVKRLACSDLTLFSWHLETQSVGRQTAINLNADVFIHRLYPQLPELAKQGQSQFSVDLSIYGPGQAARHELKQKILKGAKYKNWRLNGAAIDNPSESPERYNCLAEGDYAIMEFYGETKPKAVKMTLVCASVNEDKQIHSLLDGVMPSRSMAALSAEEHPELWAHVAAGNDEALEDAVKGGLMVYRFLPVEPQVGKLPRTSLNGPEKMREWLARWVRSL